MRGVQEGFGAEALFLLFCGGGCDNGPDARSDRGQARPKDAPPATRLAYWPGTIL
jgi:hypothetical protein